MRILAFDCGMTCGFAVLGSNGDVASGSRAITGGARSMGKSARMFDQIVRGLILKYKPDAVAFASPFVGSIKGRPVQPNSIRPLFGFLTVLEAICDELQLRCVELDEPSARRAFLTKVPRKSKDIKRAVMAGCRERGWPASDDHAGDSLCVAAFALEILDPQIAHEVTPLFQAKPKRAPRKRKAA